MLTIFEPYQKLTAQNIDRNGWFWAKMAILGRFRGCKPPKMRNIQKNNFFSSYLYKYLPIKIERQKLAYSQKYPLPLLQVRIQRPKLPTKWSSEVLSFVFLNFKKISHFWLNVAESGLSFKNFQKQNSDSDCAPNYLLGGLLKSWISFFQVFKNSAILSLSFFFYKK